MLIYHRGRHGADIGIAESTLPAIARALDEGAGAIEIDVRLHRPSGELYILHDPSLERTTDGRGKLNDHDPNEIGRRVTIYGAKIPTLREVYKVVGDKAVLVLDIKSPDAAEPAVELYARMTPGRLPRARWKIVPSSFHHASMTALAKHYPLLEPRAIMDCVPTASYLRTLARGGIRGIHLARDAAVMDAEAGFALRDLARTLGLKIWLWTANDRAGFHDACAYGADAIFTDRPDVLSLLVPRASYAQHRF